MSSSSPNAIRFWPPRLFRNSRGQAVRLERFGPQGLRQGERVEPELAGGNGLGVLLIDHPPLALEPFDQHARQKHVVLADLPVGAGAKDMDLLAVEQPSRPRPTR